MLLSWQRSQRRRGANPPARAWFADGAKFIGHIKSFRTEETTIIKLVLGSARIVSLRGLPEMFLLRGIEFTYEAVRDWEAKLTPSLIDNLRRHSRYVDESVPQQAA